MRQNQDYATGLQDISAALIACGYTKLDKQAKALGVRRSTAWTIVKVKHKLGRLSSKTTNRILANPELPLSVRIIVQRYIAERSVALVLRAKRIEKKEEPRGNASLPLASLKIIARETKR